MAQYIRDIKYEKAKEVIDNLTDSESDKLIKYYIETHEKYYQQAQKTIQQMQHVFNGIREFTKY